MKLTNLTAAAALGLTLGAGQAHAISVAPPSLVIDITQVGNDVVATGNGSVDTSILSPSGSPTFGYPAVNASLGAVLVGTGATYQLYSGVTGPASWGTGGYVEATSGAGDLFGVYGGGSMLFVPSSYVSGSMLSGSATWENATLASLGLTPGTYDYAYGIAAVDPHVVVNVSVPEPSTWALMALGFAGLGFAGYRSSRSSGAAPV